MTHFFTSGGQSIGVSASASILPMNIQDLISFRIDWFDLLAVQGTLKSLLQHHSSKASILLCSAFFIVQLSHPYMITGKTIALTAAAAKSLQSCPTLSDPIDTAAHQAPPPRPWDSPGKNTGVGCHFLLQCVKVKSESEVAQSCLTLSNPMDCSPPGSSVHGIFQARVLEWGAFAFSIALTRQTFVGKVMSLLFNMLSRLVIVFLPRRKCL